MPDQPAGFVGVHPRTFQEAKVTTLSARLPHQADGGEVMGCASAAPLSLLSRGPVIRLRFTLLSSPSPGPSPFMPFMRSTLAAVIVVVATGVEKCRLALVSMLRGYGRRSQLLPPVIKRVPRR